MIEQKKLFGPTTPSEAAPPSTPKPGSLEHFASLLEQPKPNEGAPEGGNEPEGGDEKPPKSKPKTKPKTLAEAAEALGIDAADFYALQVPSAREGAEPHTLGKLKDLAAEHDGYTLRTLELEEQHRQRQSKFMRAEQEMVELFSMLPADALKPEVRKTLQERRERAMTEERQRVLEAIPEWQDAAVRMAEMQALIEHLVDNGFPQDYLAHVSDHRTLRYMRENMRREKQIREALEKVSERKPSTPPKSKANAGTPPATRPSKSMTREQRAAASFTQTILNHRSS